MKDHAQDERFMQRALELAHAGAALVSPNPMVGAVLVQQEGGATTIVGEGSHRYEGMKHAEVLALEAAGKRAHGSTLYINLEPCCHTGRTAPCTDALSRAGVKRVVAAMADPNPMVAQKGFSQLREAGVEVEVGLMAAEARKLNEAFAKFITTKTPLVTLKAGMTLDGKIALPPADSQPSSPPNSTTTSGWITSAEAREHVQQLRHQSDAIMVGVGTVLADDPLLTDRTGLPRRRTLQRVIFDSRLRLPLNSRMVTTAKDDVIVFCAFAEEKKKRELEARGVKVEQIPVYAGSELNVSGGAPLKSADGRPDMRGLVRRLGELEITSLLIEGGSLINWSALASGIVDKVFFFYAPKVLGGGSVPFAAGEGFHSMQEAAAIKSVELHRFGQDFAVEGYLRDPYETALSASGPQLVGPA